MHTKSNPLPIAALIYPTTHRLKDSGILCMDLAHELFLAAEDLLVKAKRRVVKLA